MSVSKPTFMIVKVNNDCKKLAKHLLS